MKKEGWSEVRESAKRRIPSWGDESGNGGGRAVYNAKCQNGSGIGNRLLESDQVIMSVWKRFLCSEGKDFASQSPLYISST